MENQTVTAKSKYVRQSPYKLRLVLNLIRGLPVSEALDILKFTKRRAADEISQVVESAIANAENNHNLDIDELYVNEAYVGKNLVLKRWKPRARGRVGRIQKPFSQLTVVVKQLDNEEAK